MIIIHDDHVWSVHIYIWWSYMIIVYDDHTWSSCKMITYDDHIWGSYKMITCDDHTWCSHMMSMRDVQVDPDEAHDIQTRSTRGTCSGALAMHKVMIIIAPMSSTSAQPGCKVSRRVPRLLTFSGRDIYINGLDLETLWPASCKADSTLGQLQTAQWPSGNKNQNITVLRRELFTLEILQL